MSYKIGKDEFCLKCMEWREYDKEGRCKVCKRRIVKLIKKNEKLGYNEYKTESPSFEIDSEQELIE